MRHLLLFSILCLCSTALWAQPTAQEFQTVLELFKKDNAKHPVYQELTNMLLNADFEKAQAQNTADAYLAFYSKYESIFPNHTLVLKSNRLYEDILEKELRQAYAAAEALNTVEAYGSFYETYKTGYSGHPLVLKSLQMKKICEQANQPILIHKIEGIGETAKEANAAAESQFYDFLEDEKNKGIEIIDIMQHHFEEKVVLETTITIIVLYKKTK